MFRSNSHFLMVTNLRFLELQKMLLNRFQIFKNEEIRILKKDNMKTILYEWAKFLTTQNIKTNITNIPEQVLENKIVTKIINDDIDCKWLVDKINVQNKNENNIIPNEELKKIDNLHFDEYPQLFYYQYPQFPYNYYDKKKMTNFYSLIKFPYNDIINISRKIKNDKEDEHNDLSKANETKNMLSDKDHQTIQKSKEEEEEKEDDSLNSNNYSCDNYIYAPSEMETSKENYHQT
ncbi:conserved Plasmodium protein, unknown function [Plasmodium vinckei vinckei]|uniref:Uncharacterized protein n=1 Tax=Plasmodium vinckei vinckei TaxID=54757 RepID=A0A081IBJ0_PLAVN|nr:conserved Plasmodium protein, unknown function [Plasmodium vinckei vinckei]KEG01048.1 hypothetical protein YYE_04081 [Plasmodium vinckei vinckei]VEV55022.1 conserved Plasmodium protein, unknown function [Plasmodium vinckei vinckei]